MNTFSFVYIYTTTKPATWEIFLENGCQIAQRGAFLDFRDRASHGGKWIWIGTEEKERFGKSQLWIRGIIRRRYYYFWDKGCWDGLGIYNYMRCLFYVHRALGVFILCVCLCWRLGQLG